MVRELPAFLRRRMTVEQARGIVRERMASRQARFVEIVEKAVFAAPRSPYAALMSWAGISRDSFRALVEEKGVEGSLCALRDAGVYVSFEEYKGRCPIVRGSRSLPVNDQSFASPLLRPSLITESGGSSGRPTRQYQSFETRWELMARELVFRESEGFLDLPRALCFGPLPVHGTNVILGDIVMGRLPERWFDPPQARTGYPWRFRAADFSIYLAARVSGVKPPRPERIDSNDVVRIARWAADAIRRRGGCVIHGSVSLCLRVSLAAREAGIDLTGTIFLGGGEALSPAKKRGIEASGGRCLMAYRSSDARLMGIQCRRDSPDPVYHVPVEALALLPRPEAEGNSGATSRSLLCTSLNYFNPRILINAEIGDRGTLEEAHCGCPLAEQGLRQIVRDVRSFARTSGESVTIPGVDLVRITDEVLPARFGGTPLDYQFVEQEDAAGFTRLCLRVRPGIVIGPESEVADAVFSALSDLGVPGQVASAWWKANGTLRVIREEPRWTNRGKFLALDIERKAASIPTGARP